MGKFAFSLDRFEGDGKSTAVLVDEDGNTLELPRSLLPKGVAAGDVLSLSIEKDEAATKALVDETAAVQERLAESDDGGDVSL
ncbi:MAG: DUF3006 domain-containing protein [Isosphaeraceae bacterium]|nr:DUF3006 domain-containing protein [Isosphaeraceae bacterium]